METAEQYKSNRYQRTVEIESRCSDNLKIGDRYEKETDFVLRLAPVQFEEGEKVLDIASGVGGHARLMAKKLGVEVDARDYSETLVEEARNREIGDMQINVRKAVNFAWGDMGNINESLSENQKYKLITILGGSFLYLESKEAHQKALNDYYELLEPGGKLVIQWRAGTGQPASSEKKVLQQDLEVSEYEKEATGEVGKFGEFARPGENVFVMEDTRKKDGFYFYDVPLENTKGLIKKVARPKKRLGAGWYDSDDVSHYAFGRAYYDETGVEEDLGPTYLIDYLSVHGFNMALKGMLKKAGFKNIQLKKEPLSPDGSRMQYAVVAEKPKKTAVRKLIRRLLKKSR